MSSKTVTFGGVFHFPSHPKQEGDKNNKKQLDASEAAKSVSVKNRFNCGSLRNSLKMVSTNGSTLISIRLVRSKLRKREDVNSAPAVVTTNHNNNTVIQPPPDVVVTTPPPPLPPQETVLPPPFLWQYSSSNGSTTASSQYTLYNNDQDNLVQTVACEEPSECKGFRKNLRGKWRRLVKKKPQQEVYTIPAELRDQLKQIYVY